MKDFERLSGRVLVPTVLIFMGTDVRMKVGRRIRYSRFERGLSQ